MNRFATTNMNMDMMMCGMMMCRTVIRVCG